MEVQRMSGPPSLLDRRAVASAHVNPLVTVDTSAAALQDSFRDDLGNELVEFEDGKVAGRLLVGRGHLHPGGYVHDGVWVAFGDTVAAWGNDAQPPPATTSQTAELKVRVFASRVVGDDLLATGQPLHRARRTQVWEDRVTKTARLAANFICTQVVLPAAS